MTLSLPLSSGPAMPFCRSSPCFEVTEHDGVYQVYINVFERNWQNLHKGGRRKVITKASDGSTSTCESKFDKKNSLPWITQSIIFKL